MGGTASRSRTGSPRSRRRQRTTAVRTDLGRSSFDGTAPPGEHRRGTRPRYPAPAKSGRSAVGSSSSSIVLKGPQVRTGEIIHIGDTAGVPHQLVAGLLDLGLPARSIVPPVPFAAAPRRAEDLRAPGPPRPEPQRHHGFAPNRCDAPPCSLRHVRAGLFGEPTTSRRPRPRKRRTRPRVDRPLDPPKDLERKRGASGFDSRSDQCGA